MHALPPSFDPGKRKRASQILCSSRTERRAISPGRTGQRRTWQRGNARMTSGETYEWPAGKRTNDQRGNVRMASGETYESSSPPKKHGNFPEMEGPELMIGRASVDTQALLPFFQQNRWTGHWSAKYLTFSWGLWLAQASGNEYTRDDGYGVTRNVP